MHQVSDPSILYFGTPVILISTVNENGTYNVAPISSVFWLGWRCVIGISAFSKTTENILRNKECVINLPSVHQVGAVNKLALTTGSNPIPEGKLQKGYRFEADKFGIAGLTPGVSDIVNSPRVLECPVQMETEMVVSHSLAEENEIMKGRLLTIELKVVRIHLDDSIIMKGHKNRVDPDKWRPLIMSFQEFYGLGEKVNPSLLGTIPESLYRTPDIQKANEMNEKLFRNV